MPELMNSWDYLSMWNEASWNDAGNPNWDNYVQNSAPYSAEALARYRDGVDPDLYPNSIWTDLLSNNTQNQRLNRIHWMTTMPISDWNVIICAPM